MFNSKIRASIITAVAALSIVAVGPMTSVANAEPKEQTKEERCAQLQADHDFFQDLYAEAMQAGDLEGAKTYEDIWVADFLQARELGCAWATDAGQPAPTLPKTNQGGPSTPPRIAGG